MLEQGVPQPWGDAGSEGVVGAVVIRAPEVQRVGSVGQVGSGQQLAEVALDVELPPLVGLVARVLCVGAGELAPVARGDGVLGGDRVDAGSRWVSPGGRGTRRCGRGRSGPGPGGWWLLR